MHGGAQALLLSSSCCFPPLAPAVASVAVRKRPEERERSLKKDDVFLNTFINCMPCGSLTATVLGWDRDVLYVVSAARATMT